MIMNFYLVRPNNSNVISNIYQVRFAFLFFVILQKVSRMSYIVFTLHVSKLCLLIFFSCYNAKSVTYYVRVT